ncbi:MAG: hypothetical protein N7Q72_03280, partial [Spiroplasma sp. Tabriz.8]|nr:hypothetical protein [Spiroplasma sp. Tabriz.8]
AWNTRRSMDLSPRPFASESILSSQCPGIKKGSSTYFPNIYIYIYIYILSILLSISLILRFQHLW